MSWLRAIWAELLGLFVDDAAFAGAILLWVLVMGGAAALGFAGAAAAILLFAGLAVILVVSAVRKA
jgi:hypothetical protein